MLQTLLSGLLAFGLCAAAILLGRLVRFLAAGPPKAPGPRGAPAATAGGHPGPVRTGVAQSAAGRNERVWGISERPP